MSEIIHAGKPKRRFGIWNKNVENPNDIGRVFLNFIEELGQRQEDLDETRILSAAVGNGSPDLSLIIALRENLPFDHPINYDAFDLQEDGIDTFKERFHQDQLPNVSLRTFQACIGSIPDGFNNFPNEGEVPNWLDLNLANNHEAYDALFFCNALHWLPVDTGYEFLRQVGFILKPGALLYLTCCTPFNRAAVNYLDPFRMTKMEKTLFGGHTRNYTRYNIQDINNIITTRRLRTGNTKASRYPFSAPNDYSGYNMTFCTLQALMNLLDSTGFDIISAIHQQNPHFPNGYGLQYPENIAALAQYRG